VKRRALLLMLAVVTAAPALLPACAGVRNRRLQLQDAVNEYNTAIRWGHLQRASRYVPDDKRAEFIARKRQAWRRLKVHEVEVRSVHLSGNQERARVLMAMAFSVAGNPVIQRHMIEQRWRFGRGGWVVVKRARVKAKKVAPAKPGDLY